MPRTPDLILAEQVANLSLERARLMAQVETLKDQCAALTAKLAEAAPPREG